MTAVPKELTYQLPPTLSGMSSYELRVPTYTTLGMFNTQNAVAQLQIPMIPNTWMDGSTAFLSGEVQITMTAKQNYVPPAITSAPNACILGSGAWSMFNRVTTYFNSGVLLEDIQNPNIYVNAWRELSQNNSDQLGDSIVFGGQDAQMRAPNVAYYLGSAAPYNGTFVGTNSAAATPLVQIFKFAVPIPGYLGMGSAGRLIPMFAGPHRLDLSLEALANFTNFDGTYITSIDSMQFNRLEFVAQVVKLTDPMQDLILSALPAPGQISIRANQVSATTVVLQAGANGMNTYTVGTRVSSCKAMLLCFNPANTLAADGTTAVPIGDKIFGSVNPDAQMISYEINGTIFPQQYQDLSKTPDAYARLLQCMGVFNSTGDKPGFGLTNWAASLRPAGPCLPFGGGANFATVLGGIGNCFWLLQDLEVFGSKGSGSGFFSGQNTTSGSNFLRIQFARGLGAQTTTYVFTIHDAVITYDIAAMTASRRI